MSKKITWLFIIIALLVGAYIGYYYEKTKMVKLLTDQRVNMQQQIDGLKKVIVQPTPVK